jgi:hypothetical protein
MQRIRFDFESGALMDGLIWEIIFETTNYGPHRHEDAMWCECISEDCEMLYNCSFSPFHFTGTRDTRIRIVLAGGMPKLYLPSSLGASTIVQRSFLEDLIEAKFTGIAINDNIVVEGNQTMYPDPELAVLEITGSGGIVKRWIVDGENKCPFCAFGPMCCPGCGKLNNPCVRCSGRIVKTDGEKVDAGFQGFILERRKGPRIVEGACWDGSDWFCTEGYDGGTFITSRLRTWLLEREINGVTICPALLNIANMGKRATERDA